MDDGIMVSDSDSELDEKYEDWNRRLLLVLARLPEIEGVLLC